MPLFAGMFNEHPTMTYEDAEAVVWDNYPEDFRTYWGLDGHEPPEHLDEDSWRAYKSMAQLVERLASGASQLTRPRKTSNERLAEFEWLQEEADELRQSVSELFPEHQWAHVFRLIGGPDTPVMKVEFMHACMQLEAVGLYPDETAQKAERLFDLATRFLLKKPGQRCREYLPRVAECYVRGLDMELAVMARAVLDAALQDEFSDDVVRLSVGGEDIGLERRIQCALKEEVLDEASFKAANRVRKIGNAAVHADLGSEIDAGELLSDLYLCLNALEEQVGG